MKLSILICTLPDREKKLNRLLDRLVPQLTDEVEVKTNSAGSYMPTGTKRNNLIRDSIGDYFVFIDDDDLVSEDYVSEILTAIESNPDCITFPGLMTTNGGNHQHWTIRLGSKYEERNGHYYRWPNHISPMKRIAVEHIKFPDIWIQEDYLWSRKIHELGLLKTEVFIDKEMYHYDYNRKPRVRIPSRKQIR